MSLSRGASLLFHLISKFVKRYGPWGFFCSQAWIARQLKCCVRTVGRYVQELLKAVLIAIEHRPNKTPLYNILQPKMSEPMSDPYKEEPSVITSSYQKKQAAWPAETLVNEYGRRYLNPMFLKVRDAVKAATGRIRRARNPQAYEMAIVRSEMRSV